MDYFKEIEQAAKNGTYLYDLKDQLKDYVYALSEKAFAKGDAAAQARRCLEIIQSAIERLDGKLSDVLRTRILLTRIEDWQQVAAVHGEFFGSIRPANTIMQVVRFIDPDWLIEIEADAIVEDESSVS